jgi:predicted nucleic acid-binding protein
LARGLDTNILCYALDPAFPENLRCRKILLGASNENKLGLNPTVLHETYHTLVFDQKWAPSEARRRLLTTLNHPHIEFYSQTRRVSVLALDLAAQQGLGGRDALILSNFLANNTPVLYSHDRELLGLGRITWKRWSMRIEDPLT